MLFAIASPALANRLVFEDPGVIQAYEGSRCKELREGDALPFLFFDDHRDFPTYVDQATVVLNGWSLRYVNGDHQVNRLQVSIDSSSLVESRLSWGGSVTFNDNSSGDYDAYLFCYWYLAVGWSTRWIDAVVADGFLPTTARITRIGGIHSITETAPVSFSGGLRPALLPRGFDAEFADQDCFGDLGRCDREVFQVGYSRAQPYVLGSSVNWGSRVLLKDDSSRKLDGVKVRQGFVAGSGVEALQGAFALEERSVCKSFPAGGCIGDDVSAQSGIWTVSVERNTSRYDYAFPMLTGVDLSYVDKSHNVKRVGAWIQSVALDSTAKSLRYSMSSVLVDEDLSPRFVSKTSGVTLLGFNRRDKPKRKAKSVRSVFESFPRPMLGAYRVDACERWSQGCGQPSADRFCRGQFGPKSSAFKHAIDANVGKRTPTMTQIDRLVCAESFCGALKDVVCEVPIRDRYYDKPKLGEYRVDFCASWAKDCGQAAADLFCRTKSGQDAFAVHFSADPGIGARTPTRTQRDKAVCSASFCGGFSSITCRDVKGL